MPEWWFGPLAWERVGYVPTTDGARSPTLPPKVYDGRKCSFNDQLLGHELDTSGGETRRQTFNNMWSKKAAILEPTDAMDTKSS